MSQDSSSSPLSLSPFVKCLSCIVELGSWVPLRDLGDDALRGWRVSHEVVVELIVPDGSKLEITCEEPAQCKQQRKEREKKAAQWWSSESTDQESYDIADQHSYEGDESGAE